MSPPFTQAIVISSSSSPSMHSSAARPRAASTKSAANLFGSVDTKDKCCDGSFEFEHLDGRGCNIPIKIKNSMIHWDNLPFAITWPFVNPEDQNKEYPGAFNIYLEVLNPDGYQPGSWTLLKKDTTIYVGSHTTRDSLGRPLIRIRLQQLPPNIYVRSTWDENDVTHHSMPSPGGAGGAGGARGAGGAGAAGGARPSAGGAGAGGAGAGGGADAGGPGAGGSATDADGAGDDGAGGGAGGAAAGPSAGGAAAGPSAGGATAGPSAGGAGARRTRGSGANGHAAPVTKQIGRKRALDGGASSDAKRRKSSRISGGDDEDL
ncbi:hypothetical protein AURDEDRAFT_129272 [Auricularia subglabra TFB-10046 SS5]|nr:hypothetical protein AURDEDRAFT_129272 [Auricularia subglabra TFB-10046 SS5]